MLHNSRKKFGTTCYHTLNAGEMKQNQSQHSVKELRGLGIQN